MRAGTRETGCMRDVLTQKHMTENPGTESQKATVTQRRRSQGPQQTTLHSLHIPKPPEPNAHTAAAEPQWTSNRSRNTSHSSGKPSEPVSRHTVIPAGRGRHFLGRSSFKHLPLMNPLCQEATKTQHNKQNKQKLHSLKGKRHTQSRGDKWRETKAIPTKAGCAAHSGGSCTGVHRTQGELHENTEAWAGVSSSRPISNLPPPPKREKRPLEMKRNQWISVQ